MPRAHPKELSGDVVALADRHEMPMSQKNFSPCSVGKAENMSNNPHFEPAQNLSEGGYT